MAEGGESDREGDAGTERGGFRGRCHRMRSSAGLKRENHTDMTAEKKGYEADVGKNLRSV